MRHLIATFRNVRGNAAIEYLLTAAVVACAAVAVMGHGSAFFQLIGALYRALVAKLAPAGNALLAASL